ncbi:hypothetical protein ACYSNX_02805 [Myroides sp. LJL115]
MSKNNFERLAKEIADCSKTLDGKKRNLSNLMKVNDIMNKHPSYKRMNINNKIKLCMTICIIVSQSQTAVIRKTMCKDIIGLDMALE